MTSKETITHQSRFWQEIQPIVNHALAVLLIEASLLIIGWLTHLLQEIFPAQVRALSLLETVDAWTALAILCLFAFYTVVQVALRLTRSISEELKRGPEDFKGASAND